MKTKQTEALANEPTGKLLLKLSAPAMAGMFFVSIYNVVDAFFVGRGVGPLGMAAVFITFPASLLVMAVAQTFGVGGASVIARKLGAGEHIEAQKALGTVLSVGGACAVVMGVLFWLFAKRIITGLGGSEDILGMATSYAHIIFFGTPMYSLMMIMNNTVRGEGNTQLSMWSMAISSLANIILDPIFIFVLKMGVAGAAIATVIAQTMSMIWLLSYYLSDRCAVPITVKYLKPSFGILLQVVQIGSSAFVRQAGFAFTWGVLNRIFAATGGDIAVAVSGLVSRMNSVMMMPMVGMGHGLLPIVGYNYGAKTYDRVLSVMKKASVFSWVFCFCCALIMLAFPKQILSIFSDDATMLGIGVLGARFTALGVPVMGIQVVISTYFQGTGKGLLSFFLSMLRPIIIHPLLATACAALWGLTGTWASFPLSQLIAFGVSFLIYVHGHRELKKDALALTLEAET